MYSELGKETTVSPTAPDDLSEKFVLLNESSHHSIYGNLCTTPSPEIYIKASFVNTIDNTLNRT